MFKKKSAIDFIVCGLGNKGVKYKGSRHNVGFEAVDYIAQNEGTSITRARFDALTCELNISGKKLLLMKPQTYMNLSGIALQKALHYYKLTPERVIVIYDDISLAPGVLRIRSTGSAGGHNGIKSIIQYIGADFLRIKIGVGERSSKTQDLADFVLSSFGTHEKKLISERFTDMTAAVSLLIDGKEVEAKNRFNG